VENPARRMIYQTDTTRERIIDIASALFTERGLFDTHMRDVAAAASLSRTSLYRYFRDKLDLGFAVIARIWRRFDDDTRWPPEGAALPETGLGRLMLYLRTRWLNPALKEAYAFIAEFDSYFSGRRLPGDFKDRISPSINPSSTSKMETFIMEGIEDGSVRSDLDPHLAMVTILNAIRGLQQRLILRSHALIELKDGEADRMCDELLEYLERGIASGAK